MPKYMNSQQTMLYDKSNHVFGLHQAKKSIREANQAVIVEGNFDVLASHQVNVKNVVATAGTALTVNQLKQLKRLTDNVAFAFDQDKAGLAATMRAIPIAQAAEINLSIITLPDGKDPDDLIQKDLRAWQKVAENANLCHGLVI
jgi:DNA primase